MKATLVQKAHECFLDGRFSEALTLYKELRKRLDTIAFDFNISMCNKKISESYQAISRAGDSEVKQIINKSLHENMLAPNKRICLIRIIGNDLPGLHAETQGLENLKFILANEPEYPGVDKVFLLNRIVSRLKRDEIKSLLKEYGKIFFEQVFQQEEYINVPLYEGDLPEDEYWSTKKLTPWEKACWKLSVRKRRNAYLMNNNGARNYALEYGIKKGYRWVLPFDGNCFLSKSQLAELCRKIETLDDTTSYLVVPMERCLENFLDLAEKPASNAVEEPQIAFKNCASLKFDEKRVYGNQPKVELLKRLGVPGLWDNWDKEYPWKKLEVDIAIPDQESWRWCGSVFRLASGNKVAAVSSKNRSHSRANAIIEFCDDVYHFSKKALANRSEIDFMYYCATEPFEGYKVNLNDIFEHIYLVSLPNEREKRLKVARQLEMLDANFQYFEAIDGNQAELLRWFESYKNRPIGELKEFSEHSGYEKSRKMKLIESAGAVGYIHTYISILKDAKAKGYKNILILEDDIVFCNNFKVRLGKFIDSIDKNWKMLLLGASQYGWDSIDVRKSLNSKFYYPRIHETKGSFAIAFDHSIYDEIIDKQSYMEAPFDNLPLGVLYEKYLNECFVAFPYLVMPDVSKSTIRETRQQYSHANRVKWWTGDFKYPQSKFNLGLILTSAYNAKYLSAFWKQDLPVRLSILIVLENGVVPVHTLEQIPDNYYIDDVPSKVATFNLSFDALYMAPIDLALTEEILLKQLSVDYEHSESESSWLIKLDNSARSIVKGRVSIVLPTYKRASHLKSAAESIIGQNYQDVEILIVDDNGEGSDFDVDTEELVYELIQDNPDKNIRYIKHKINSNGASARNTGIFSSTGEYISFLDDDDIYLQGRLQESVESLEYFNDDIGAVYCGFLGWNSSAFDPDRFAEGNLTKEILALDYMKHYLHTNTATYKRSVVLALNGFNPTYPRHQDLEFNLRFFELYRINAIRKCLVQLSPKKSSVDNKVYGMDMFNLKKKFLQEFSKTITCMPIADQKHIYSKHWAEVLKFAKDKENFRRQLKHNWTDGALQIELMR